MLVLKYLCWKFRNILNAGGLGENQAYVAIILACLEASNDFMSTLYKSGLFLSRLRLTRVVRVGKAMLRHYRDCASFAFGRGLARYKFNPKFHMLCHIVQWLEYDLAQGLQPINPLASSCQMPEDFINRVATLSRSVGPRQTSLATINLYKVAVCNVLREDD